jgi:class 3 adenylate cyclase
VIKVKRNKKIKSFAQLAEDIVGDSADVFLLFADLCGSTAYKEKCLNRGIPDFVWISRQLIFLERANELVKVHQGVTVKTMGDGLFAYFSATTAPDEIIKCAIEIIQAFKKLKTFQGEAKIDVKVSIDFGASYNGEIINSRLYDPIGTPVDRCSRLNSIANNNEILFSEQFLETFNDAGTDFIKKYNVQTFEANLKGIGSTKCYRLK